MQYQKIPLRQIRRQSIPYLAAAVILTTICFIPKSSQANDLNECMAGMMHQADDSMTIGDLRLECEK